MMPGARVRAANASSMTSGASKRKRRAAGVSFTISLVRYIFGTLFDAIGNLWLSLMWARGAPGPVNCVTGDARFLRRSIVRGSTATGSGSGGSRPGTVSYPTGRHEGRPPARSWYGFTASALNQEPIRWLASISLRCAPALRVRWRIRFRMAHHA